MTYVFVKLVDPNFCSKEKKIKFLKEKDAKQKRRRASSVRRKIERHFERLGSGKQFDRETHVKGTSFPWETGFEKTTFSDPQRRSRQPLFIVRVMVEDKP